MMRCVRWSIQGMAGFDDARLMVRVEDESRVLMTMDKGIADVRAYQPHRLAGPTTTTSASCAPESMGAGDIDNGIWNVYFGPLKLGRLLEEHMRIEDANGKLKPESIAPSRL